MNCNVEEFERAWNEVHGSVVYFMNQRRIEYSEIESIYPFFQDIGEKRIGIRFILYGDMGATRGFITMPFHAFDDIDKYIDFVDEEKRKQAAELLRRRAEEEKERALLKEMNQYELYLNLKEKYG